MVMSSKYISLVLVGLFVVLFLSIPYSQSAPPAPGGGYGAMFRNNFGTTGVLGQNQDSFRNNQFIGGTRSLGMDGGAGRSSGTGLLNQLKAPQTGSAGSIGLSPKIQAPPTNSTNGSGMLRQFHARRTFPGGRTGSPKQNPVRPKYSTRGYPRSTLNSVRPTTRQKTISGDRLSTGQHSEKRTGSLEERKVRKPAMGFSKLCRNVPREERIKNKLCRK